MPVALVAPLPSDPVLGPANDDATVGQYIVDWRAWGREARARYDALVEWSKAK